MRSSAGGSTRRPGGARPVPTAPVPPAAPADPDRLPRCRITSWPEIERWADRLAAAIRDADRRPGTIVALTRGGWVPARLLSDRLGVRRLLSLRVQHWGVTATRDGRARITERLSGPVRGEEVLLLDDLTDTGDSLDLARRHLAARGPGRLETATFLHMNHSRVRPSYTAEEIPADGWAWIVFPWNYWEDLRSLAARARARSDPAGGVGAVRRMLEAECGWTVPDAELRIALAPSPAGAPTPAGARGGPVSPPPARRATRAGPRTRGP